MGSAVALSGGVGTGSSCCALPVSSPFQLDYAPELGLVPVGGGAEWLSWLEAVAVSSQLGRTHACVGVTRHVPTRRVRLARRSPGKGESGNLYDHGITSGL